MHGSRLAFLVVLALIAGLLPFATVSAANGDNLRTLIADRTGTDCASTDAAGSHGSVGVGIAFDGADLLISCYSDNTLTAIDPTDGSQVAIHAISGASFLGALAWDDGRGLLWACSNLNDVGTIDLATDSFAYAFTSDGCFDGLAYDASDDTLYSSADVASTVEHYTPTGTLLSSNAVNLGVGGASSGIAVGGPNLYLANNGYSQIYEVPKDFSSETLFATFPARLEDLECDNLTFAGLGKAAIWSIDAYDNVLNAWEIPAGACEFGGGGGDPSPCGPMDVAFIIDDTGSMGGAIANVKAEAAALLTEIDTASGGDDQLALVTFKDNVTVIEDLAAGNEPAVSAAIGALTATGGAGLPEASDEALNTVVNGLDATDRAPGQQNGDFDGAFRPAAVKIVILITDALPGGFDDAFTAGVDDVNAHSRATEAAAASILISAIYVPTGAVDPAEVAVMTDYATTTGGSYVQTNADGTGTAAAILEIVENCGGPVNTPPTADAGGPYTGDEGSDVAITGAAADADADPLTTTWSYAPVSGVDAGAACSFANSLALTTTVSCTDDGVYDLTLTADDGNGGVTSSTTSLTISNVAPSGSITSPGDASVFAVNTLITLTSSFGDPGDNDTHVCQLDWGVGAGFEAGSGELACTGTYTYADAGVYTVTAQVTDDDGGVGSDSIMLIVYDPSAGFVTGGGWITSPGGAYADDPTLAGKATFGFVSKYKKGASAPDGNTEFQFQAASFNFHSSAYEWLVVTKASKNAQFKGTGTVNGALDPNGNPFTFMLWATDASPDTFRIKIWYEDGGVENVVYDNGSQQPISSGSIVVHTK